MHNYAFTLGFSIILALSISSSEGFQNTSNENVNSGIKNSEIKSDLETLSLSQKSNTKNIDKVYEKVIAIDDDIQKLIKKKTGFEWWPPLTNLSAVIIGGLISAFMSYIVQQRQTKFEIGKSLMDWKVKQLSELYGPLYALLHQSNAIYRQMNIALSRLDRKLFRLVADSDKADLDQKIFQIFKNNEWVIFRTITHIESVYGKGYGVEIYFDELLGIGERIAAVIENRAGYVREDQPELADVFGKYLAHYTVLRQLHRQRKKHFDSCNDSDTPVPPPKTIPVDHTAAFPREVQRLIQEGYQKINKELNNWGEIGGMNE